MKLNKEDKEYWQLQCIDSRIKNATLYFFANEHLFTEYERRQMHFMIDYNEKHGLADWQKIDFEDAFQEMKKRIKSSGDYPDHYWTMYHVRKIYDYQLN